jgi:hypothetical protein
MHIHKTIYQYIARCAFIKEVTKYQDINATKTGLNEVRNAL